MTTTFTDDYGTAHPLPSYDAGLMWAHNLAAVLATNYYAIDNRLAGHALKHFAARVEEQLVDMR